MRFRHLFPESAFECVTFTYASASTADNLGITIDWYNNYTTLTCGGLHYGNGGNITPIYPGTSARIRQRPAQVAISRQIGANCLKN
jgi:hypothetical protein